MGECSMTTKRNELFSYMDLGTRGEYLDHQKDFEKYNQWQLTPETAELLMEATEIAWDTETISVAPPGTYKDLTKSVRENLGLTYLTSITHVVFHAVVNGQAVSVVLVAPFAEEELTFARQLFARDDCLFMGHNHGFDLRIFCGHHDIPVPKRTYCTLVGQTTMIGGPELGYPDGSRRSLESLVSMYDVLPYLVEVARTVAEKWYIPDPEEGETGEESVEHKVTRWLHFMKKCRHKLQTLPVEYVATYVVTDGIATYRIYKAQMHWSKVLHEQWGYDALWERHLEDQEYQNILSRWTVRGMPINREWIKRQLERIQLEKERVWDYFIDWGCGLLSSKDEKFRFVFHVCESPTPDPWYYVDFGYGRGKWYPADMQHGLWTKSAKDKIPVTGWEEGVDYSKWWSTGAKAVRYYLKFGPEKHRSKLRLYRYFTQMVSQEATYREWLDHSEYDGKVHPVLTQSLNTGRTNGSTPNPLNVNMDAPSMVDVYDPATGDTSSVVEFTGRGMLAPHPGKVLIELDASNAEIRLAAVIAQAEGLSKAFAEGRDLHKENASAYFQTPYNEVTYKQRFQGKSVFFAEQYGGGSRSITSAVYQPLEVVEDMQQKWNSANFEVGDAKKRVEADGYQSYEKMKDFPIPAFQQAYTVLWNGRWVPAPTYRGKPKLYPLWNSQQQGGVAGILAPAIIKTTHWLRKHPELGADLYLMIHDSTIAEVPEDNEEAAVIVGEYMSKQLMTQIPYQMTVVKGHKVPWPSGCNLFENKDKWGWRPDKEFPYECGPSEEDGVVIGFSEEKAWEVMLSLAQAKLEVLLVAKQREIDQWEKYQAFDTIPWLGEDGTIGHPVTYGNVLMQPRAVLNEQARFWSQALDQHLGLVHEEYRQDVGNFVEWVQMLDQLQQEYAALAKELEELEK